MNYSPISKEEYIKTIDLICEVSVKLNYSIKKLSQFKEQSSLSIEEIETLKKSVSILIKKTENLENYTETIDKFY